MGFLKTIFVLAAVLTQGIFIGAKSSEEYEAMKDLLRAYTREPPEGQTTLRLGIYIMSILDISHQAMEYTLSMYFRQSWKDKRLVFQPFNGEDMQEIVVPDSMIPQIWTPDTFFRNEKKASYHQITVPNRLLIVNNTGWVWYVTKITATFSCPMDLHNFPMDKQECPLMFESFGLKMDRLLFHWLDGGVDLGVSNQLPQFTLYDIQLLNCSQNYTSGWYPCVEVNFLLERDTGFYIMQIYIPSVFIVILSWLAFSIAIECIAARAGIGLTALVTMAVLSVWSRSQLPIVSYATAMDVWTMTCFIFVFASVLEFVIVHFLSRREAQKAPAENDESSSKPGKDVSLKEAFCSCQKNVASSIDTLSKIIFPLAFLLFNIIYWSMYKSGE